MTQTNERSGHRWHQILSLSVGGIKQTQAPFVERSARPRVKQELDVLLSRAAHHFTSAQQISNLDPESDLFEHLSAKGIRHRLAVVDPTAREGIYDTPCRRSR